jgi:hypothetical protein
MQVLLIRLKLATIPRSPFPINAVVFLDVKNIYFMDLIEKNSIYLCAILVCAGCLFGEQTERSCYVTVPVGGERAFRSLFSAS